MKPSLLLDTHVALWWLSADNHLTEAGRGLIRSSQCHISAASIWEVAIKYRLGKLAVPPGNFLGAARSASIRLLSIRPEHAAATADLPLLHKDPFDRLLIAQARHENMVLLTADAVIAGYGEGVRITP
ncbi:MAG: type II toxin-antitoxin system VapC family toxin [Candidatus Nitricoxidivorans perseverans]|uniref:Type II toxin-antitoxin system VapC family toxin n=1 Tax=Candidatus Nitricoxidivorans perseverans TaxID=2975601 RepID=A0AA49J1T3_9PROT|nr:MAG: type II toxin-antitoxin system VapC family toxin [Candidatus Nitricoxidivorans perseverans]